MILLEDLDSSETFEVLSDWRTHQLAQLAPTSSIHQCSCPGTALSGNLRLLHLSAASSSSSLPPLALPAALLPMMLLELRKQPDGFGSCTLQLPRCCSQLVLSLAQGAKS